MVILKSKWLIHLMYENGSDYSAEILVILIISFIAYSMMHIFSSLLTAAGHLKTLNKIFFIGIVVNLCSNFWLIPKMGAKGAAITTACSEVLVLLAIIFLVWRFLGKKKANQKIIFRKH
jgi:O-antigen/teichoic acid export membrane protein